MRFLTKEQDSMIFKKLVIGVILGDYLVEVNERSLTTAKEKKICSATD